MDYIKIPASVAKVLNLKADSKLTHSELKKFLGKESNKINWKGIPKNKYPKLNQKQIELILRRGKKKINWNNIDSREASELLKVNVGTTKALFEKLWKISRKNFIFTGGENSNEATELANRIQNDIQKIFPKSYVKAQFGSSISPGIWLTFSLGDKNDWSNKIIYNDPVHHKISVGLGQIDKEGNLPDKLTTEASIGGSILTPDFERIKIGFRKKTGSPEAVAKYLKMYFDKVKKILEDNKDKIPENLQRKF